MSGKAEDKTLSEESYSFYCKWEVSHDHGQWDLLTVTSLLTGFSH